MKNLILIIIVATLSPSLFAQTLKVSYKSHSSSMTTLNLANKSFGLPDHLIFEKLKKIEEQTIETKPIQTLSNTPPSLKKVALSTPKDKKALKKQQKEAKRAAKKKAKKIREKKKFEQESEQKPEKKKSISQASLVNQGNSSNNLFQVLLLLIGVIVIIVAALPTSKKNQ